MSDTDTLARAGGEVSALPCTLIVRRHAASGDAWVVRHYLPLWYGFVDRMLSCVRADRCPFVVGYPPLYRYNNAMPVVAQLDSCSTGVRCHWSICVRLAVPTHGLVVRARLCAFVSAAASGVHLLRHSCCVRAGCCDYAHAGSGDSYLRHRARACVRAKRCAFVLASHPRRH